MNKKSLIILAVIVVAIIGIVGYMTSNHSAPVVKGTSNSSSLSAAQLQIGSGCDFNYGTCTGTAVNQINTGFCYVKAYAATIAASSSATVDCQATAAVDVSTGRIGSALTGVQKGDAIIGATFSTTTSGVSGVGGGIVVVGSSASSTNGYITLNVANLTGATYTWPTNLTATGTVQYFSNR